MADAARRLREAKRALREEVIAARDGLPPTERAAKAEAIATLLLGLPEVADARNVMAFWPFGSEVDTVPVIERLLADGATVALPRIEGGELVPVRFESGMPMAETWFGGREPAGGDLVDPGSLDLVVVPGVAFDRDGGRVGYGLGFYDRFLTHVPPDAPKVAVAFALQVVYEVPAGPSDHRVDAIVTEDEVIRCR